MSPSSGHILVIDADANIRELLDVNLDSEGYGVKTYSTPEEAGEINPLDVHLVIIDSMERSFSGIDFIAELKDNPQTSGVGVFLCTAAGSQSLVIEALDAGADDFIAKPFSLRELLARVKSYMRRHHHLLKAGPTPPGTAVSVRDLNIDLRTHTITKDGMPLGLSKTESQILELLARNVNTYVSRAEIHSAVWNNEAGINDRIVDTNISRLRKKMGDAGASLVNRTGIGYMLSTK
ncbi:MAG: response regulator transcription factor [Muribaculaceae bacterium]|nr:response regulator transcription factor [Muribaculaceae bacterium]